jgi:hypothetical protein
MHNAFQLGTISDHVMQKTIQVDPKHGLISRMKLMNELEGG